jgi:lipid-A-disaccharide synthase
VLYYISPQIWAWRAGRVKKSKARVDHMAVILPFEQDFYERHGVPVTFVGHPLMDACDRPFTGAQSRAGVRKARLVLGLLPGSRDREVRSLLPLMLQAGRLLKR